MCDCCEGQLSRRCMYEHVFVEGLLNRLADLGIAMSVASSMQTSCGLDGMAGCITIAPISARVFKKCLAKCEYLHHPFECWNTKSARLYRYLGLVQSV